MARRKSSPAAASDDSLRRQREEDAWNRNYLRDFYNRRREVIMQSGDVVRIRLLSEHDERERNRQS